jgi:2-polyprenyl-6-methoxyphenol hydroxylase-like FAD-dependent oxidoreductase
MNMKLDGMDVVVVGAAMGGATAALLLARSGARVTLLEKVAEPRAVGAGIAVAENGLAVLEALGLGRELTRMGTPVEGVRVVDGGGRTMLQPRGRQPRALMMKRSELYGLLLGAVAAEPRITLRLGADVLLADTAGVVVARTAQGETTLRADLVIGADGVHSRVRADGDFGARVRRTGVRYARLLAPAGLARGEEAWTKLGLFGSFALPDATYAYASAHGPASHLLERRADLPAWKEAWARAYAPAAELLAAIDGWEQLVINEVIRVDCARYFDGRLALLGDAAHSMAPNVGQGGNSAIVDAAVLAAALHETGDVEAALRAYDARRRPAVRKVADASERLGALAGWSNPLARFLRDRALMPLAQAAMGEGATAAVMQESTADLTRMCAVA